MSEVGTRGQSRGVRWNSSSMESENWHIGNLQPCSMSKCVIDDATPADRRVHGCTANRIGDTDVLNFGPIQCPAGHEKTSEQKTKTIPRTAIEGGRAQVLLWKRGLRMPTDGGRRRGASTAVSVDPLTWLFPYVQYEDVKGIAKLWFHLENYSVHITPRNLHFAFRTCSGQ